MQSIHVKAENETAKGKVIEEINTQIFKQYEFDQRQDVFDPSGYASWVNQKLGGFDFGQNSVSYKEASKKELKEKKKQDIGLAMISNSFAKSDALESQKNFDI